MKPWEGKHWKKSWEMIEKEANIREFLEAHCLYFSAGNLKIALQKDWEEQQNSQKEPIYCECCQIELNYCSPPAKKMSKPTKLIQINNEKKELFDNEILSKVATDISDNHNKIIDDWCKAYMAQSYKEGVQLKPGSFTLNEMVPTLHDGLNCLVKKYWFEPGIPQFHDTEKEKGGCQELTEFCPTCGTALGEPWEDEEPFNDKKKAESFTSSNENDTQVIDMEGQKWISVDERIPNDWEDVLATDGKVVHESDCYAELDGSLRWYIHGDNPFDGVIAWMEKPKPPGE